MASTYGVDPYTLLTERAWQAHNFNKAVFVFGRRVNGKLEARDENFKPKFTFEQALGIASEVAPASVEQLMAIFGSTADYVED